MGHTEVDWPEPCEVEDPRTGERYLMFSLPQVAWPRQPRVVYECPACGERYPAEQWSGACTRCAKRARRKRRRD